jgi:hypothetical protein
MCLLISISSRPYASHLSVCHPSEKFNQGGAGGGNPNLGGLLSSTLVCLVALLFFFFFLRANDVINRLP